jgi:hypothetical protein
VLELVFESVDGPPVLESEEEALARPLEPGADGRFEFRFENLAENWNYRVPAVRVIRVGY